MRLLADGMQVSAVAEKIGVDRRTVRVWRDSDEGQIELRRARDARADLFRDAAEDARKIIRESLAKAAQVLADDLDSEDAEVRNRSARTLLDRGGVPRTERVETVTTSEMDLSQLTDDEVKELQRIKSKARKV